MFKNNNRRLLLLFSSHIISGVSSGISMIAIPWYFTNTLNSNSMFSFLFGVVTFLGLFWGLYSGTIIDRYCRKTILEKLNFYTGSIIFIISSCFSFFSHLFLLYNLLSHTICFFSRNKREKKLREN